MTHFVNPKEVGGDLVPYLVNMTKKGADQIGGADYTFDCTGNVTVMRQALEALPSRLGRQSIIIGVAPRRRGDRDAPVPARHRPRLEGHRLRRRARPHRRAEDRRLVHGREDRDRPDDHPHAAARRHQQGLRPDACRQIDPQRGGLLMRAHVSGEAWQTTSSESARVDAAAVRRAHGRQDHAPVARPRHCRAPGARSARQPLRHHARRRHDGARRQSRRHRHLRSTCPSARAPRRSRARPISSPPSVGDTAHAECTPLHRGRSTMVWQTRITRGDGKLAAMVTQTQMVIPKS